MVNVGGIVSVGGSTGAGGGSTSGITTINPGGNTGPTVSITGVNGITVTGGSNQIVINGAAVSGSVNKYAESFIDITSGVFTHNLGTLDVLVQVRDRETGGATVIIPDMIIVENLNQVSVLFNRPQSGRIVII